MTGEESAVPPGSVIGHDGQTDLLARLDRLESESAIRAVLATYCHGVDRRDPELFAGVWHEDAECLGAPFGDRRGRDAIVAAMTEGIWPTTRRTCHWVSNVVLDIDHDRATSTCDVDVMLISAPGNANMVAATYDDVLERREQVWRMASRTMNVLYTCQLTAAEWKQRRDA